MDVVEKILGAVEPSLTAMGYRVLQLRLSDAARRKTLSLMAERLDARVMSFDDCTQISRTVSALLDVEDPISGAYHLEVCSPGVDRPLFRPEDYVRYQGYEVKLETLLPVDGRKRFRGVLGPLQGSRFSLATDQGEVTLALDAIKSAKLVMTDALMQAYLKGTQP